MRRRKPRSGDKHSEADGCGMRRSSFSADDLFLGLTPQARFCRRFAACYATPAASGRGRNGVWVGYSTRGLFAYLNWLLCAFALAFFSGGLADLRYLRDLWASYLGGRAAFVSSCLRRGRAVGPSLPHLLTSSPPRPGYRPTGTELAHSWPSRLDVAATSGEDGRTQ